MAAGILTAEAATQANLNLTTDPEKGRQAMHDVVVALQANRRSGTACTKRRGEVAGSGKKLWKQKGTGNARMGSRRSPIWSGGATVWGPRPRDFSKITTKKVRTLAFRASLTARINNGDVILVEALNVGGKTKDFVSAVNKITDAKKVLIIGTFDEPTFRAARNVAHVQLVRPEEVNTEHLLNYAKVVVTNGALEILARRTATE
jgi:large subunit ribosomal protein L4